jgi:cytochrome c peroxidase
MDACARWILLCGILQVGVCAQEPPGGLSREQALRRAQTLATLGRKMFFDPSLSGSGKLSCASCHDPALAYGSPNAMPVQRGGTDMAQWGTRAVPSLKYLQVVPQFTEHYFDSDARGDDSVDNGPTGGLTWDGRVDRGRDQARIPLLSPYEMANDTPESVVAKALNAKYAAELKRFSGDRTHWENTFKTIVEALEAWEQADGEFYPYTSKYDAWLHGEATLSFVEENGRRLFNNPDKGNCARCHLSMRGANGTPPQFTDYGLIALGAPRNNQIPANSNPDWYDLGLCGPARTDLRDREEYCGRFMTPSLRNVATRRVFFHNGAFHTLREVVQFYAQRDTNPEKWYPRSTDGRVRKFNDLPAKYHPNVETGPPFGGSRGGRPALTDEEVDEIVAFLGTLTDGYRVDHMHRRSN